jgi:hypothetical protein
VRFLKLKTTIKLFSLAIIIFGCSVVFSANQIPLTESEVMVEISPKNPIPLQNVTIKISSYSADLNRATITWKSESGVVSSGIGKTSYTFKAPEANISTSFTINISTPSDGTVVKKINIRPSDIDVFWESTNGYTPPFYKGKSFPITNGSVKVVAIPNFQSKRGFSYVWRNQNTTKSNQSGYDKSYYIFNNSMFDEVNQVAVTATSVSGDYVGQKSVEIKVYKPEIIFYKKDPIWGVDYNKALVSVFELEDEEEEITIVAEPYYFPIEEDPDKFIFDWKINNKTITTPTNKKELSIRPTSRDGYAIISLNISRLNEMFQKSFNSLKINF